MLRHGSGCTGPVGVYDDVGSTVVVGAVCGVLGCTGEALVGCRSTADPLVGVAGYTGCIAVLGTVGASGLMMTVGAVTTVAVVVGGLLGAAR